MLGAQAGVEPARQLGVRRQQPEPRRLARRREVLQARVRLEDVGSSATITTSSVRLMPSCQCLLAQASWYACFSNQILRRIPMSTIEQTTIPTGTWTLDPVHSKAAFAVKYSGIATFRGHFSECSAELARRHADRRRRGRQRRGPDRPAQGPPAVAGLLRRRAAPADHLHRLRPHRRRRAADRPRRADHQGRHPRARGDRHVRRPLHRTSTATSASPSSLETVVNRHDFGISWNADLPTGGKALGRRRHPDGRPRADQGARP